MDVDGVLTDGRLMLIPMPDGSVVEAKSFSVNDGAALAMARRAGLKTGIISGRGSAVLTKRAEELKVDFFYHGLGRKKAPALEEIFAKTKLPKERVCYVGDDVQDLPLIHIRHNLVLEPVAVADEMIQRDGSAELAADRLAVGIQCQRALWIRNV